MGMADRPRGGGGGGRTLGPAQNTFGDATTANRAAAEALRDAYTGANAAWLTQYNGNRTFLILLEWTGDGDVVQRRNVAGDDWSDVTDVIKGRAGAAGAAGPGVVVSSNATYDAANNRIDLPGVAAPGIPSILFVQVPADLDRKAVTLTVRAGVAEEDLGCPRGTAITARLLTPGETVGMLRLAGAFQLAQHPQDRPQDYRAVFVVGSTGADNDLVAADLATARAAVSAADSGGIDIVAAMAAANVSAASHRRYWWIGVPDDAPDPAEVLNADSDHFTAMAAYAGGPDYGGAAYRWWRGQRGWTGAQRTRVLVVQGRY